VLKTNVSLSPLAAETSWLDNKHVVFGTVLTGYDECVLAIEALGSDSGALKRRVIIKASGIIGADEDGRNDQDDEDGEIDYEALARELCGDA